VFHITFYFAFVHYLRGPCSTSSPPTHESVTWF